MFLFQFLFFLYAVTMLNFQILKRITSSETWFNYVVTFFFPRKCQKFESVGRRHINGEKKKRMALVLFKEVSLPIAKMIKLLTLENLFATTTYSLKLIVE